MTLIVLLVLGVFAGALTTVAGLGGGLLLLLGLSLVWDPVSALAVTAPALFVGNAHRVLIYRREIDWSVARAFALGAVPGAALGALFAVAVPWVVVAWLMVGVTALSIVRALGCLHFAVPSRALAPAGLVVGGLTGSAGGAGVLVAPLFLSAGLVGESYVGTSAVSGVAMHFGRIAGYGAGGLFTAERVGFAAWLTLAILAGNQLGRALRRRAAELPEGLVEHVVLVVCAGLALLGVGRG